MVTAGICWLPLGAAMGGFRDVEGILTITIPPLAGLGVYWIGRRLRGE